MHRAAYFRLACAGAWCGLMFVASASNAATPEPRLKPAQPHFSQSLTQADFERLQDGLDAAERGNWSAVKGIIPRLSHPTAVKILTWRRATSDATMSFSELDAVMNELADWPRARDIRAEAEGKVDAAGLTPAGIVAWFEVQGPQSGEGKIAYAEALFALGRHDEGETALRDAWRGSLFSRTLQADVLNRHGARLTTEDHVARVDYLLWRGQRTTASRLFDRLPADERALADARMKLAARARGVDTAIDRVPAALQDHPGLVFERAKWRRRSRNISGALPLVMQLPADMGPSVAREEAWEERAYHIYYARRSKDWTTAYQLAAANGLDEGGDFAEAEWLAGWLALRELGDIEAAKAHFAKLDENVSTPVSKARALYWRGRAAESESDFTAAQGHYAAAAAYSTVYYGQLAATRLGDAARRSELPNEAVISDEMRAAFISRDLPQALKIFAELDELRLFREFSYTLDDQLETAEEYALLAEIARDYGQQGIAVRGGKAGLAKGVIETSAVYPKVSLAPLPTSGPEEPFVLALARQESEFYPKAISHANAHGLMQLLPSTAQATARSLGRSYRTNWLTDDADYNVTLGSAHLGDLLDDFDGSYILAAAAYNAGAHRAREWIREYGDPRTGEIDPIDWVEMIPFSETRNYVQRVMENVQVYRARLTDDVIEVKLDSDLARGGPPS